MDDFIQELELKLIAEFRRGVTDDYTLRNRLRAETADIDRRLRGVVYIPRSASAQAVLVCSDTPLVDDHCAGSSGLMAELLVDLSREPEPLLDIGNHKRQPTVTMDFARSMIDAAKGSPVHGGRRGRPSNAALSEACWVLRGMGVSMPALAALSGKSRQGVYYMIASHKNRLALA